MLEIDSFEVCQSGLYEEAELHWREDKKLKEEELWSVCRNIKHSFQRIARECPDVKFLALNVNSGTPQLALRWCRLVLACRFILDHLFENDMAINRQTQRKVLKFVISSMSTPCPQFNSTEMDSFYGSTKGHWNGSRILVKVIHTLFCHLPVISPREAASFFPTELL